MNLAVTQSQVELDSCQVIISATLHSNRTQSQDGGLIAVTFKGHTAYFCSHQNTCELHSYGLAQGCDNSNVHVL